MSDKFSFFLDNDNAIEKTDLEILGLSNDYFKTNDINAFKNHVKKIVLDIHPDKNEGSVRSGEAFKVVRTAVERIKENIESNKGTYVPPANISTPTQDAFYWTHFGFNQDDFSWWDNFIKKAKDAKAKWKHWEEDVAQDTARKKNQASLLKDFDQMTPFEQLQARVQNIHQNYQNLFNAVVDEYLSVADQWTANGFIAKPELYDIREYGEQYFDIMTNFHSKYAKLLEQTGSSSTLPTSFKLIESSFDSYEMRIPIYIRPNNIPFDLPQFIDSLNYDLNYNLKRFTDPELRTEKSPRIEFSYTGKNLRVASLYEKKPRNYHQLTINALVEAHSLLHDWWISNKKPGDWKLVTKVDQEVFKQSDFCKLLEAHPTLRGYWPWANFELYLSAFEYAGEGCLDVQSLVNAIKKRLKGSSYSYSDFDDFSAYTGTNEKVLQLIKEKAEAEQAKIQNPYNEHIEEVYRATKELMNPEDKATVLKNISTYYFTSINFSKLCNEKAAVATAFNEAVNPDGSFNLKVYQHSINSVLKNKLNQNLVYTGKNESIQDYFHPKHPADFHQITVNKLLEAHVKVKPWWNEYGPSILGDKELREQFYQSEFCKIMDKHPTLKNLYPSERRDLYLSIFKDYEGRYDIPAFIHKVKKTLQKSHYIYQSYADFSEYTGASEAINKTVQAAELAAAQKNYNKFLEEAYKTATVSYHDRKQKRDWFKTFNHKVFLSIDPDKLNQLSMLDSYMASLGEKNTFDLVAFQTALNSVLETHLNLKMQYTGINKKVLEALQVPIDPPILKNTVESKPPGIPAVLPDKIKENTRESQPILEDLPRPNSPDADAVVIQQVADDNSSSQSEEDIIKNQPILEDIPRPISPDTDAVVRQYVPDDVSSSQSEEDTITNHPISDDIPISRARTKPSPQSEISQTTAPDTIRPESVSEIKKSKIKHNANLFFSASPSSKKEGNASNLQDSLQAYINERKKEWSFHYNFLGLVALVYFFHDKIWGTHYSDHKSRESKIKAAENIMNGKFPLNDAERAAANEGRLGKLLSELGGLEEIMKKASEPTKDDQSPKLS